MRFRNSLDKIELARFDGLARHLLVLPAAHDLPDRFVALATQCDHAIAKLLIMLRAGAAQSVNCCSSPPSYQFHRAIKTWLRRRCKTPASQIFALESAIMNVQSASPSATSVPSALHCADSSSAAR